MCETPVPRLAIPKHDAPGSHSEFSALPDSATGEAAQRAAPWPRCPVAPSPATGGAAPSYTQVVTYNAIGNLTAKSDVGLYTYPASGESSVRPHAVTETTSGWAFSYDANGNMTSRTVTEGTFDLSYTWENRLAAITQTTSMAVTRYYYDADGALVKKVGPEGTTHYVGAHYEKNVTTGALTKYYAFGAQRVAMRTGGTLSYLYADHLGSASLATDADGNVTAEMRYYPYGETRWDTGMPTDRRFTGQRSESYGLIDFQARYYDGKLGRFLQADTVVPNPSDPQSLARYTYVRENPLGYRDPTGHWWEDPETGALMPGYSSRSLPESWKAGRRCYKDAPAPQPSFEGLPIVPTNEVTSQWFGATRYAHDYGGEWNYDGYCQGMHCGIDVGRLDSEYGSPVRAGLYGTVESVEPDYKAGPYAVNVRVGSYVVIYGHLDGDILVKPGDVVNPDTVLAGVGNPYGAADKGNVHLHLEIRYRNQLIYNPLLFMGKAEYEALTVVLGSAGFYYTDKWATPLDQPVIVRGGPNLWAE